MKLVGKYNVFKLLATSLRFWTICKIFIIRLSMTYKFPIVNPGVFINLLECKCNKPFTKQRVSWRWTHLSSEIGEKETVFLFFHSLGRDLLFQIWRIKMYKCCFLKLPPTLTVSVGITSVPGLYVFETPDYREYLFACGGFIEYRGIGRNLEAYKVLVIEMSFRSCCLVII